MKSKYRKIFGKSRGFTLVEVLITILILSAALIGILQVYLYCSILAESAGNLTIAVNEAQSKMEEIRDHKYTNIVADYGPAGVIGDTFPLAQINGLGVIYVDALNADQLEVKISVSFQNKDGRVVGDDQDLDGDVDTGEDPDNNSELESPAMLVTRIARRL